MSRDDHRVPLLRDVSKDDHKIPLLRGTIRDDRRIYFVEIHVEMVV